MPNMGDRERKQLDPFGDYLSVNHPEFLARVRSKIGDPYKSLVSRSKAVNVLTPDDAMSTLGLNTTRAKNAGKMGEELQVLLGKYDPSIAKHVGEATVIGIGAGASPSTFAHEFRHDDPEIRGSNTSEIDNRVKDLVYSNSHAQYVDNLRSIYQYWFKERPVGMSTADVEAKVLNLPIFGNGSSASGTVRNHRDINREGIGIGDYIRHPIDAIRGDMPETSVGKLPKSLIKERAEYPFLNFVGSHKLPELDPEPEKTLAKQKAQIAALRAEEEGFAKMAREIEAAGEPQKKAKGGRIKTIPLPPDYRKGGRVRMI